MTDGTHTRQQGKVARRLYLFSLLLFLTFSGGRIASSDGNTMFALSSSLLSGRLTIDEGWNGTSGRNGGFYAKAEPGQAVLTLPWVIAGKWTAPLLPSAGALRANWPRMVASTFNAWVAAGAVVAFFLLLLRLGYGSATALTLSLGLAVATPLLPYSKSFMREPLLMLSLLLALGAVVRGTWGRCGLWLGLGMLVKSTMVLQVPLVAVGLVLWRYPRGEPLRPALLRLAAAPLVAVALLALYNWLRFGHVLETGYDPTVDTFSTPLLVGLYGQLLSSGKSIFLYAPLGLAALWGYGRFCRRHPALAVICLAVLAANLVLHARFSSWAGEGSWGPRYLVPFLPCLILPAAELLATGRPRARRAVALALVIGTLVQLGGSAIYFGSYMRDLGEYPYQRNFADPLFMYRSHFVPNHSPVVGHWRLLWRNARLLGGPAQPDLRPTADGAGRLPLADGNQDQLRYVVDYWFCYGLYARLPAGLVIGACLCMVGLTLGAGWALRRAATPAARSPQAA